MGVNQYAIMLREIHTVYPNWQPKKGPNSNNQIFAVWSRMARQGMIVRKLPYQTKLKLDPPVEKYEQIKMEGF